MLNIAPLPAARRLAAELKLPSWKGTVLCVTRQEGCVLVVAADERWLRGQTLPKTYCGYPVETEAPLNAIAH